MTATIQETITTLRETLQGYIEATYHIADPRIVAQRRALLDAPGSIFQTPYLESTPRYETADSYRKMKDLPPAAREAYLHLSDPNLGKPLIFDPPYSHQAEAIRTILRDRKNAMIMTGTGSGKTESFLLPIFGKFAIEAKDHRLQFADYRAVRAMVLYPMNALVNDQLGRLRLLFGDPRVVEMFEKWSGRAATFARYTSRTPYAGVRTRDKDRSRLRSIGDFFVEIEQAAARHTTNAPRVPDEDKRAHTLLNRLRGKGKWPAKGSISDWFGSGHWMDKSGAPLRAIAREDDAELITRDEVQRGAPDLLITNYSMLEYMMLRPIERTIFDSTKAWLAACPHEKFLLVLDEAHLYRGAQGAEVGLLIRRLRERLDIPAERFQVICATASFSDKGKANAGDFGSQLSGVAPESFVPITGALKLRPAESTGSETDVAVLSAIDLDSFFGEQETTRAAAVAPFLAMRGIAPSANQGADLVDALSEYGPFSRLVNETMRAARSFSEIREVVFPSSEAAMGDRAINALLAMGSRAKRKQDDASLLPCRVHAFYRGLPGLWACMDPHCSDLAPGERGGPIGRLYAQPRERCTCDAPVLEYFTCRYCGTSYGRAYTKDATRPDRLYQERGQALRTSSGLAEALQPIDLLLEQPTTPAQGVPAHLDLASGLLNPAQLGARYREVFLRPQSTSLASATSGSDDDDESDDDGASDGEGPGQFIPCGCCDRSVRGKSSVQDHLTKGDQPFQALVAAQIRVQPPNPLPATEFAPLRGRKVLVFSDSRQVAARLAPALQVYSLRDTLRALLPLGYRMLGDDPVLAQMRVLDSAWVAIVVAAHRLGVRLRPELDQSEVMPRLEDTTPGATPTASALLALMGSKPPTNLTRAIVDVLRDNILGLEALAIGSIVEAPSETDRLTALPSLPGIADRPDVKLAVARAWLRCWARKSGIWFRDMPDGWWGTGRLVRAHKGDFRAMQVILNSPQVRATFKKDWLPRLLQMFTEQASGGNRMVARKLSLELGGQWHRCGQCTSVHRPISTVSRCIDCGSADSAAFDPDTDAVFKARKGFYRDPIIDALTSDNPVLMSLIAAEHTAQLNASQADSAFSQAEQHEMQFQDIDVSWRDVDRHKNTSIDVLSSTTTMEVGIDIGDLSGVALRNMPPGRANYQQRAGRAGRRANAVATVVAFGSADSHDDHYFTKPQEMIRGQVVDPRLTLENSDIARRHIRAFLLQRYHEARLPALNPSDPNVANLFSVLGKVGDFVDGGNALNRADLGAWLLDNQAALREAIDRWLPSQLESANRARLLQEFVEDLLKAIDDAVLGVRNDAPPIPGEEAEDAPIPSPGWAPSQQAPETEETESSDAPTQADNEGLADAAAENLLDRLLYYGVLPRYAFPTDVAPFYVFSPNSTGFRPEMQFAPSQGLNIALSQYAPNKQIWIKGKQYTSKAIYSPYTNDRKNAWGHRRLYYECNRCGHAKTDKQYDASRRGELLACEACNTVGSFGPAKPWFRPPGFAHPWGVPAPSVPDEPNETAYATRAKLVMTGAGALMNTEVTPQIRAVATRQHLLVSNSGPDGEGYDYCTKCGRIESVTSPEMLLSQPHSLPFPNDNDPNCPGMVSRRIVLGTDFPTDIALFALRFGAPFRLPPGNSETASAMRTICEAVAKAACRILQLEPGEILAEHRPALNADGATGSLVEIFLYDTLAGGAGFSPKLADRGKELFEFALEFLTNCPERCDTSCYRCLRSFRNKLDHALLDRFVGQQLVQHLLTGQLSSFNSARASKSLNILASDLTRILGPSFAINAGAGRAISVLRIRDKQISNIDLQAPCAPGHAVFGSTGPRLILADELRIRRNLGAESENIVSQLSS